MRWCMKLRVLTLFALGDYTPAAAALNSFLSSAPGMDWTTMSSLYGSIDDYQRNRAISKSIVSRIPTNRPRTSCWPISI